MNIPFNWVDSSNKYQDTIKKLDSEPQHSGRLNLWRDLRDSVRKLQDYIGDVIENDKKNFSDTNSTMRNTLKSIGTELDSLDARITSAENSITSLTSMLTSTQQMLNRVDADVQALKG